MYQNILFDLDGTLTDPGIGITNSVAYALKKWNIEVADRSELYKFIGPPLHESFKQFYQFTDEQSEQAIEYYREYFREKGMYENEVYDGIENMLIELKARNKNMIVATSKPEEFAVNILKHFHLDGYFDFIAGATMDGSRSKKADVILYAMKHCGIQDLSSTVMVGDREQDIIGATQVGIASVGVLFGYGSYEELHEAGATYIAENVENVLNIL